MLGLPRRREGDGEMPGSFRPGPLERQKMSTGKIVLDTLVPKVGTAHHIRVAGSLSGPVRFCPGAAP